MKLTANDFYSYGTAFILALLLHAGVVALMAVNWDDVEISRIEIQPYYIDATVVAENPYTAEEARKKQQERTAIEERLRNRRLTEEQLRQEQAEWEKQQAEKRRQEQQAPREPEVVEQEVQPVEKKQEAPRPNFADELAHLLEREANARKAVTDDEKALAYVAQIQREIIQNWSRPPSARNGMQALLRVHLIPTGEVVDVKLEESSGNDAFDRSAIQAVQKAQRFIVPADGRLFERNFRQFTVLFRPDDLRL